MHVRSRAPEIIKTRPHPKYLLVAMSARRQVAVIGAGFSGLCCLRHLSKHPERFELTCYEQAEKLGGTWVYTDKTERDEERGLQIHSSMYKNLR